MSKDEISRAVHLPAADVLALKQTIAGDVFLPDDPEYAKETATYNALVPPRPALGGRTGDWIGSDHAGADGGRGR